MCGLVKPGLVSLFLVWVISRFIFSGVKVQDGVSGNWNLAMFSGCNLRSLTASWYRIPNVAIELGPLKHESIQGSVTVSTGFAVHEISCLVLQVLTCIRGLTYIDSEARHCCHGERLNCRSKEVGPW